MFLHCTLIKTTPYISVIFARPSIFFMRWVYNFPRFSFRRVVGARSKFTNRRRERFDDSSLWMKSIRLWARTRRIGTHIVSIRVSFKCLRASSREIYDGFKRLEGAKVRRCKLWARGERNDGGRKWSRALLCASFVVRENRSAELCPRHYISGELLRRSD